MSLCSAGYCVYWCQSCFVCSGLAYEIYFGRDPSTCVHCAVGHREIPAPLPWKVLLMSGSSFTLFLNQNVPGIWASFTLKVVLTTYIALFYWYYLPYCNLLVHYFVFRLFYLFTINFKVLSIFTFYYTIVFQCRTYTFVIQSNTSSGIEF